MKKLTIAFLLIAMLTLTSGVQAGQQPREEVVLTARVQYRVLQPTAKSGGYGKIVVSNRGAVLVVNGVHLGNGTWELAPGRYAGFAKASLGYGFPASAPVPVYDFEIKGPVPYQGSGEKLATMGLTGKCWSEFNGVGGIYPYFEGAQIVLNGIVLPNGTDYILLPGKYRVAARPLPGYRVSNTPWITEFEVRQCQGW